MTLQNDPTTDECMESRTNLYLALLSFSLCTQGVLQALSSIRDDATFDPRELTRIELTLKGLSQSMATCFMKPALDDLTQAARSATASDARKVLPLLQAAVDELKGNVRPN